MKDQEKISILTKALERIANQKDSVLAPPLIAAHALLQITDTVPIGKVFEIDKIYISKLQTAEKFLLKEIVYKNDRKTVDHFKGIWIGRKHLGICPLGADRLINE